MEPWWWSRRPIGDEGIRIAVVEGTVEIDQCVQGAAIAERACR